MSSSNPTLTQRELEIVAQALADYQEGIEQRDDLSDETLAQLEADLASIEAKILNT